MDCMGVTPIPPERSITILYLLDVKSTDKDPYGPSNKIEVVIVVWASRDKDLVQLPRMRIFNLVQIITAK